MGGPVPGMNTPGLPEFSGLAPLHGPAANLASPVAPPPPLPTGIPRAAPAAAPPVTDTNRRIARWAVDAWLLARQDSAEPQLAVQPSYGRSQAGAVLRYQLAPGAAHDVQAYARASAALAGPRERELAAGLSARPLPALPLRVYAEARVGESGGEAAVRPALFAVTELSPQRLPLGLRGEAYLQAGYVGGDRATAFVDGQARAERPIARRGEAEFTAGAGGWGGAQTGAARLDIGPTASASFPLGSGRARIAADFRLRVAGTAAPASGAAVTLSAGF